MVERAATSQGVRFRGNANNTWDSARDVNSNNSVVNCNANNGGSAQRLKGFVVVARSAEYIRRGSNLRLPTKAAAMPLMPKMLKHLQK